MSSTGPRCNPRFPTSGVLLDNSALVRLWKCETLDVLGGTVGLHAAGQVAKEFKAQGPAERAAFDRLGIQSHGIRLGTREYEHFCLIQDQKHSTRHLGEKESLAVALARSEQGELLPFVTYDRGATSDAVLAGIVTLDFLDTLAWLVGCGVLTAERADEIEALATPLDGWKRPVGYTGSIETVRAARQSAVVQRIAAWRAGPTR